MKRLLTLLLMLILALGVLVGCGAKDTAQDVDLTDFYDSLAASYDWEENARVKLEGELLERYYPGISAYSPIQLVAWAAEMSAGVSELLLMECESAEEAAAVAELCKARIETQKNGAALYPEAMEAWSEAQLLQNGCYVAMIADSENGQAIADAWNAFFS